MLNTNCTPGCEPGSVVGLAPPPCFVCEDSSVIGGSGDFSSSSGWVLSNGAVIAGGTLSFSDTAAGSATTTALQTILPGTYHYAFDIVSTDGSGPLYVSIAGTSSGNIADTNLPGHIEGDIVVTTVANNDVVIGSAIASAFVIDNLAVTLKPPVVELLANGSFADTSAWTVTGGTISGGVLTSPGFGTASVAQQPALQTLVAGDYLVSVDVVTTDGGSPVAVGVGGAPLPIPNSTTVGTHTMVFTSTAVDQLITFRIADSVGTYDNFSVTKV